MFGRGVVFLKPATKHLSKKTVVVVFCCCDCCGGGGGAGCVEPHRGTRMQLRCFKVELGIYKWKIVDCVMQQKSLQRRCWIRQHWHSRSWICDVMVSQVSELVCLAYLLPQNEHCHYGFNWPHFWFCFWGTKHCIQIVTFCSISFKFISWGIADLGPLLDVMQQRPDLIIEMAPQSLGEAGSAESAVRAECCARGSEWRGHEAGWRHSFAKKWGHQFNKHHAPSRYTINRPKKFRSPGHIISLGSVTMLHVSSYMISCFIFLCKPRRSKSRHCWKGKLGPPLVFRPPQGWESHDLKTLQVQRTYICLQPIRD